MMKPNPVVLIVTSRFGDGHLKVAEAISQSFCSRGITSVHIIDLFAEVHPRLNSLSRRFYLNSTYLAQEFYGLLYEATRGMKPGQALGKFLHSMGKLRVLRVLEEIQPDVIIHTFPYLAAAQLMEETAAQVPIFTVITDYVFHGRWLHPSTSKYFVATEELKLELQSAAVPGERIVVSGIPVRRPFEMAQNREELLQQHGLSNSTDYLLLAAGAYGVLSGINGIIQKVLDLTDYDLIVVCGNNHKLRATVEEQYVENQRVHILGYTGKMHELMCISSCILTKAGGITLSEAVTQALPAIVYRPLPGQEAGNAAALAGRKIIDVVHDEDELITRLQQLEHQEYREERRRMLRSVKRESPAEQIVSEAIQAISMRYPFAVPSKTQMKEGQVTSVHGYL